MVCQEVVCGQPVFIQACLGRPAGTFSIPPIIKDKDPDVLIQEEFYIIKTVGYVSRVPVAEKDHGGLIFKGEEPAV